jgi:hypothetical protein
MTQSFHTRMVKAEWARRHPEKVRESNRRWRAGREAKLRRQAKERMRRWRARIRGSKHLA